MKLKKSIMMAAVFLFNLHTTGFGAGYILTGGPGSGKTTLIRELEFKDKNVVYEVAEHFILLNKARENKVAISSPDFDFNVASMQLKRENHAFRSYPNQDIFIDRTVFDNLAYIDFYKKDVSEGFLKIIQERKKHLDKYKAVFLIKSLGKSHISDFRQEDLDVSLQIEQRIENVYRELGLTIIEIPADTVENRTKMILEHINLKKIDV